ncbi:MAG: nucleotidyltransferase family protein, partial [Actinobacteria bacterium]
MPDQGPVSAMTATQIVAATLRVDAVAAEVIRGFGAAGIESRLLKGAALARWLYTATDPRWYSDCDVLVRPSDLPAARTVLQRLGFVPEVDEARMPDWWREHAVAWLHEGDSVVVDVHVTLPGVATEPGRVWDVLSADPEPVTVGGAQATMLPAAGRALHVALHAAQHGPDWGGAVAADLERALQQAGEDTWRGAAELAARLEATAAFATGLRLSAA